MKKKEIQIRHVFTPQVILSGAPGFSKYWEEYTDYNGDTQYYSPFTGQPYGVPSREGSGTVSFLSLIHIYSDHVPIYHPVEYFLYHLPRWDGKDRILELANRVPCDNRCV